jgi:cytoskeletal protein CcmA (bactofilin family)
MNENNQDLDREDEVPEFDAEQDVDADAIDRDDVLLDHARLFVKPSIISEGFEFTGEIRAPGALSVEGVITGKIAVDSLTIGAQGRVNGEVTADSVNVKGQFSGQMVCQDITVGGRSVVDADLTYASIVVQRGGVVKGDLHKK